MPLACWVQFNCPSLLPLLLHWCVVTCAYSGHGHPQAGARGRGAHAPPGFWVKNYQETLYFLQFIWGLICYLITLKFSPNGASFYTTVGWLSTCNWKCRSYGPYGFASPAKSRACTLDSGLFYISVFLAYRLLLWFCGSSWLITSCLRNWAKGRIVPAHVSHLGG